jgi:hypothetical protein
MFVPTFILCKCLLRVRNLVESVCVCENCCRVCRVDQMLKFGVVVSIFFSREYVYVFCIKEILGYLALVLAKFVVSGQRCWHKWPLASSNFVVVGVVFSWVVQFMAGARVCYSCLLWSRYGCVLPSRWKGWLYCNSMLRWKNCSYRMWLADLVTPYVFLISLSECVKLS